MVWTSQPGLFLSSGSNSRPLAFHSSEWFKVLDVSNYCRGCRRGGVSMCLLSLSS